MYNFVCVVERKGVDGLLLLHIKAPSLESAAKYFTKNYPNDILIDVIYMGKE